MDNSSNNKSDKGFLFLSRGIGERILLNKPGQKEIEIIVKDVKGKIVDIALRVAKDVKISRGSTDYDMIRALVDKKEDNIVKHRVNISGLMQTPHRKGTMDFGIYRNMPLSKIPKYYIDISLRSVDVSNKNKELLMGERLRRKRLAEN